MDISTEKNQGAWPRVFSLFRARLKLTLLLSVTILISTLLESFGFGMILPVLDAILGAQSSSSLSEMFGQVFSFLNIEMTLLNVVIVFGVIMALRGVFIVLREGLRSYFSYSYTNFNESKARFML